MLPVLTTLLSTAPVVFEWRVQTLPGDADTVLLFFKQQPPKQPPELEATWRLEVDPPGADGCSRARWSEQSARGAPRSLEKTLGLCERDGELWLRRGSAKPVPLVTRALPPRPLSTELVPCTTPLMPRRPAVCSGASRGPLGAQPVPLTMRVTEPQRIDENERALVLFGSMFMVFPGERGPHVEATLVQPPHVPSAELARWAASKKNPVELPAKLDTETAGAMLVLGGKPSCGLVVAAAVRVTEPEDRWALLRLARQRGLGDADLVSAVARLTLAHALPRHGADPRLVPSALEGIDPMFREGVTAVLDGKAPALQAQAARFDLSTFDAEVMQRAARGSLTPLELETLAFMLPPHKRLDGLAALLDALSAEDGAALLEQVVARDGPTQHTLRREVSEARRWLERAVPEPAAGRVVKLLAPLPPDDAVALFGPVLDRAAIGDRLRLLVGALRALPSDDHRLALLAHQRGVLTGLDAAGEASVLAAFTSRNGLAAARKRLAPRR